ncbi:MAG: exostosin family protein [Acidimicrobiia bacterium]
MAREDRFGEHSLTDQPSEADVVLFTECHLLDKSWLLRSVWNSPVRRQWRSKSYVYNERDNPWCLMPGLYASYPSSVLNPTFQAATPYYRIDELSGRLAGPPPAVDLLFSFTASPTHPSREPLFQLKHERAVIEKVDQFAFYDPSSRDFEARRVRFAETVYRSQFVLCPRGGGLSSIRMYEAMAAGRVPVVIADDWAAPAGPEWEQFVLRFPEGQTQGLIELLEANEHRAAEMGRHARTAFEDWIATSVAFHRLVDRLKPMVDNEVAARFPWTGLHDRRFRVVARSGTRNMLGRWKARLL